jgi:3-dehydroquinate synthase
MWTIGNLHLDRQSYVVAVGGASVLDMLGFATSIVHRGLRLVRVPTTTLAQNDAGVGVKNGMDEHGAKNFLGTFAPPFAVIDDFNFLATLSQDHWIGGAAEAFKVAIIKDEAFFDFLCESADDLRRRDADAMQQTIRRCAAIHLDHIRTGGDPFELGSARPLDFGHWAAHKLELMSHFQIGHGQAVAVGIAIDSYYAMRKGLIDADLLERIVAGLARCGLPIYLDLLHTSNAAGTLEVLGGLEDFREHLGGALTVTLPDGIGRQCQVHQVGAELVTEAVDWLKQRASQS